MDPVPASLLKAESVTIWKAEGSSIVKADSAGLLKAGTGIAVKLNPEEWD